MTIPSHWRYIIYTAEANRSASLIMFSEFHFLQFSYFLSFLASSYLRLLSAVFFFQLSLLCVPFFNYLFKFSRTPPPPPPLLSILNFYAQFFCLSKSDNLSLSLKAIYVPFTLLIIFLCCISFYFRAFTRHLTTPFLFVFQPRLCCFYQLWQLLWLL
jgi:hypothetical protein